MVKTPSLTLLAAWDLEEWAKAVNSLSDIPGIQPVRLEDGKVIQPLAPGDEVARLKIDILDPRVSSAVARIVEQVRERGFVLGNLHGGNIFYDPKTGEVTIVDLGQLSRVEGGGGDG